MYVEQLNAFGKVYRHPSGRIIDISFYGLVNLEKDKIKLNKENNARFEKKDKSLDLVFDHDDIINLLIIIIDINVNVMIGRKSLKDPQTRHLR